MAVAMAHSFRKTSTLILTSRNGNYSMLAAATTPLSARQVAESSIFLVALRTMARRFSSTISLITLISSGRLFRNSILPVGHLGGLATADRVTTVIFTSQMI